MFRVQDLGIPSKQLYRGYIGIYRVEGFPKLGVPFWGSL